MAGQVYSVSTLGGYTSQPYLSERLRHVAQPYFVLRQFADVKEAIGKNRGDTFLFDKASNVLTQGGTLVETSTIPQTNFTVNQGSATITEYGNSIPYTGKLMDLSQFQLDPVIEQKLRDDMVKVIESAAGAQFVSTQYIAVCTATNGVAITTNGTATATAAADMTGANVRQIVNYMKRKLIPRYDGRNYICVGSVNFITSMFEDTPVGGWANASQYTGEFAKNIFSGEVGTYYTTKFIEETGYFSNSIGTSSLHGQGVFFGSDCVYEAVAVPEDIRTKVSLDYGRDMGLAWYALLGFKTVWNLATDGEQHIVFVTSA